MLFVVIGICTLVAKCRHGKSLAHAEVSEYKRNSYGLVNSNNLLSALEPILVKKSYTNL